MAISAFQKLVNKLFQQFTLRMGREPQTPKEWMDLQNEAVQYFNKTKGAPSKPKAPPFQGWNPKVIQGCKKEGIESLLESGAVKKGVAPKTKLSTLEGKKQKLDKAISKEEWIAKKHRENKEAVERFEKKFGKKKTVEDFRDEGDWDPSGFAGGGPVSLQQLIDMYMEEGMSHQDAVQAAEAAQNLPWDTLTKAKGGRVNFIFGGSAGLKALIKRIKGRNKRIMPSKIGIDKRDLAKKIMPREFEQLENLKIEQLENLLEALKLDKQQMGMRASHKALNDPGLDFLTKKLDEMPQSGLTPEADLAKYTDIDKDILVLEQMIKNKSMKGRKPHESGGLAYMLGEPTYMKAGGGSVGHGPWTTGQTPQGPQPQPEMPQPQVMGTPDPLKAPRLPSVAPRNMDPQHMQQQMMQQAMGQQGIPQGIPRVGMMYGGDPGFAFEYGGSWADWHDQHRNAMPIEDYIKTKLPKERLPFRAPMAGGGMGRRAFMKLMAGLTALPFIGKGLTKKAAAPVVKETAEVITRTADGMPKYIYDLIEVVKAKGTRDIIEGFKRSDYSTVHRYKGVEVIEDANGATRIIKPTEGVATDARTGKMHEGTSQEVHIEITPGEDIVKQGGVGDDAGKVIKAPNEYFEGTVRPDMDGKMKDIEEFVDDADHLDLKKIADEIDTLVIKKASGGLAHLLGE